MLIHEPLLAIKDIDTAIDTAIDKLHNLVSNSFDQDFIAESAVHNSLTEEPTSNFDRRCFDYYCSFSIW